MINLNAGMKDLEDEIYAALKSRIKDSEAGINFISGTGKEHMALMGAIMKLGIGFRLVALTKEGIEEI